MDILNTVGDIASTIISVGAVITLLFTPLGKKIKGWIVDTTETDELKQSLVATNKKMDVVLTELKEIKKELSIQKEADQSLLRSKITETYYKNLEHGTLRQYEAEALDRNYQSYKKEDGNSFIDRIYHGEMKKWKIIP